jgi:SAM-dependent methyltransferase
MVKTAALKQVHYDPSVFLNVETVDDAVRIILTPEAGMTSAHRWKTETPYLMGLIERFIEPQSLVLDFGCGIGRLSKPLIEKLECDVIGVDISPNMLALACSCVASEHFAAIPPHMLRSTNPLCDAAIAVWTLQHVVGCEDHIKNYVRCSMRPRGVLFVVNNKQRVVPTNSGWINDGLDVHRAILDSGFKLIKRGELEGDDIAPGTLRDNTFWAAYRKT